MRNLHIRIELVTYEFVYICGVQEVGPGLLGYCFSTLVGRDCAVMSMFDRRNVENEVVRNFAYFAREALTHTL